MKNILITGVSKGLGLEITKTPLLNGYSVYGISRTNSDELVSLLSKYNGQLFLCNYDLTDTDGIKNILLKDFIDLKIPLKGFVNNAAFAYDDIVTNLNTIQLEKMFKVNVFAPMVITKYVIRNMLLHKTKGSIVHLSSISVHTGYKGLAMYASSKGALEAFSKNTAREWGERGIRSNCIVAGFMATNMSSTLSEDQKNRIYARTSLKRATDIISVSNTVEYLLSDKSNSITGQNIFVDNGTI